MIDEKLMQGKFKDILDTANEDFRFESVIQAIFEVLEDGKVTTDDYLKLEEVLSNFAEDLAAAIDVPVIPEFMEINMLRRILLYSLRAGYRYFKIAIPGE